MVDLLHSGAPSTQAAPPRRAEKSRWSGLGCCALLVLAASTTAAQEPSRWADPRTDSTRIDSTFSFARSGDYLSVLWSGSGAFNLSGPSAPLTATRTGSFSAGVRGFRDGETVTFIQDLRLGIVKDVDSRVVLIAVLPDRTEEIVFPYGRKVSDSAMRRRFRSRLRIRGEQRYAASILVRIERRRPDAAVLVEMDGVDVQLLPRK